MLNECAVFILDANAIRKLSYNQIKEAKQFYQTIMTIEEVQYEVNSLEKLNIVEVKQLSKVEFSRIAELMNNYDSVRKLVKYYENEGAADVALLAYALTVEAINSEKLFKDEIYIVTDDNDLRAACDELSVKWISVEDFKKST